MHTALNERLSKLPDDTVTYVGHEYTASKYACVAVNLSHTLR